MGVTQINADRRRAWPGIVIPLALVVAIPLGLVGLFQADCELVDRGLVVSVRRESNWLGSVTYVTTDAGWEVAQGGLPSIQVGGRVREWVCR